MRFLCVVFSNVPCVTCMLESDMHMEQGLSRRASANVTWTSARDMYNGVILTGAYLCARCKQRLLAAHMKKSCLRDRDVPQAVRRYSQGSGSAWSARLVEVAPQVAKVKVTSPMNTIERRYSVWIGALYHDVWESASFACLEPVVSAHMTGEASTSLNCGAVNRWLHSGVAGLLPADVDVKKRV